MTTHTQPDHTAAPRIFYSIDGENFDYETDDGALIALESRGKLEIGAVYESGEFSVADPMDALSAGALLDEADEWLNDNGLLGEDGAYFAEFSPQASNELAQLLRAWHDKHKPAITLFSATGKTTTHTVTAEQIAEYRASNAKLAAQLRGAQPTPEADQT